MVNELNQEEVLRDKNSKGKDRDWRGRKIMSLKLADVFENLGYKKSMIERVQSCGEVLNFIRHSDGSLKLYQAYFCKNKLCPMCNWRRSMKYSYQTSRIVDEAIKRESKGRFLFLTLTVKNVPGSDLNKTLSSLTQSFDRLFRRAKVKKNLIGYLRSVEVTHNELTNEYHPHIHVLLMLKISYFKGGNYITQKEWGEMWSQSLKVDYVPMIDIRAVKEKGKGLKGAILETAKYPTKPIKLEMENKQIVDDLYNGLYRKRQLGYGGLFKIIKKELALDDAENGDLIHTSEDNDSLSEGTKIVAIWNAIKQNYYLK
ncbi:TPA: protein rep [Streptococcus pyogenes]|uniref:protein rep n=6 Tax=Streptococcus pyogenes TaxID=1314 RepID=UPI00109C7DAF|nr:protein rep [Streptococcus pyogenes]VGW90418.1 plasmid rolling circle replication initiator protein [Streptococcus pyogenes]VGX05099.1 plasmid rolling circle replication initiator protein [Streptococcus pyogenes]VGX38280.1 plasmid rolling circle replication initiator protein [Streptococcus pyogenes]VGZ20590.1 plasmid rolling circle replication initiator protein [Streptococcus pyogenes]VGZ50739.1 plasmid rolling circle replication initiator protein [Streptococcus pyogenes]